MIKQKYKVVTVFINAVSGFSYVYSLLSTEADELIQAKKTFEVYAKICRVTVKHYNVDSGISSIPKLP